jgi:hypothetical protein
MKLRVRERLAPELFLACAVHGVVAGLDLTGLDPVTIQHSS